MRSYLPRIAMIAACLVAGVCGTIGAEEAPPPDGETVPPPPITTESKEISFDEEIAELQALARPRSIYQFEFEPLVFDQVVMRDPLDNTEVFHYLVFRLRNRVADSGEALKIKYQRYNEVLDSIINEYDGTAKEVTEGARLVVTETDALTEDEQKLRNIAYRDNLKVDVRQVSITALVTDEIGTRFRALDPVPGKGPQEDFDFDDRGQDRANIVYQAVQDRIEELVGERLFNTAEIRALKIPPFDAGKPSTFVTADGLPDGDGMMQGEVRGVIIFDRLNPVANHFTIEVNGTSNNLRFTFPGTSKEEEAASELKVEDFFKLRVRRRAYVLEYDRKGDEFARDQDPFTLLQHGYRWVESFQRIDRRRTFALTRYFLNNIRLKEEGKATGKFTYFDYQTKANKDGTADVPILVNDQVDEELRGHYARERDEITTVYDAKIEGVTAKQKRLEKHYEGDDPYLQDQQKSWNSLMESYLKILGERQADLPKRMRDLWANEKKPGSE